MDNSSKVPTNTELVDALINDFNTTCDIKSSDQDKVPKLSSTDKDDFEMTCPCESTKEDPPDTNQSSKPDDFIDEEELKHNEESYTEEEKQKLKEESDQLKTVGNSQFKLKEYRDSALTYTTALRTCPLAYHNERAILYANRAAAKIKLELNESAVEDCSKAVELEPEYVKAILRRAQLYESMDKLDEALADYTRILEIDPSHTESRLASQKLPAQINERNEKLKTEMMGKLKDLGNMILRPFGLSTNNFQMVQDPNSGGYSISFKND